MVYKLIEYDDNHMMKLSEGKTVFPGKKKIYRIYKDHQFSFDLVTKWNEKIGKLIILEKGSQIKIRN